jgi:hypothetical protein
MLVRCATAIRHVEDFAHQAKLARRHAVQLSPQSGDEAEKLWRRIAVEDEFAARLLDSSAQLAALFRRQWKDSGQALYELLWRWSLDSDFKGGDVALLAAELAGELNLPDVVPAA